MLDYGDLKRTGSSPRTGSPSVCPVSPTGSLLYCQWPHAHLWTLQLVHLSCIHIHCKQFALGHHWSLGIPRPDVVSDFQANGSLEGLQRLFGQGILESCVPRIWSRMRLVGIGES